MQESQDGFLQSDQPRSPRRRGLRWIPTILLAAVFALYFFATRSVSNPGWTEDYQAAVAEAESKERPLVMAFHSRGCPPCAMMDRFVFSESIVQKALQNFVPVRINVERHPELAEKYGVIATPTYTLVASSGEPIAETSGYRSVEDFLRFLGQASKAKETSGQEAATQPATAPDRSDSP